LNKELRKKPKDKVMSYAKVIVNPAAGAGKTYHKWPQIKHTLNSIGLRFEDKVTEAPGHAIELAKAAAKEGYDLVVAIGGDGTLNEVVNGLYEAGSLGDVTLGIVSTGTGSDYVRTVGTPHNYEDACRCFMKPRKLVTDVGVAEYSKNGTAVKRLFINFAGIGFDAEIVRATTQRFKALGSVPSYMMGLLSTFLNYKNQEVSINLDGKLSDKKICTVIVSHGRYGGGGMLVAPNADPTDGLFDVTVIDNINKVDLLWSFPKIYKGTHLTHPRVSTRKAGEIVLKPVQKMSLQADGELLGETPARFSVLPDKLSIAI
jgi:diacylglycerol kinase (ATP)